MSVGGNEPNDDLCQNDIENGTDNGIEKVDSKLQGLNENERKVVSLIERGIVTNKTLQAESRIPARTLAIIIKELSNKEIIERVGSDRTGYWKIKK